jgi:hypothetical protein
MSWSKDEVIQYLPAKMSTLALDKISKAFYNRGAGVEKDFKD